MQKEQKEEEKIVGAAFDVSNPAGYAKFHNNPGTPDYLSACDQIKKEVIK